MTDRVTLRALPATAAEMDQLATETKQWVPYEGPEGGDGWRNTETDEIVYDDEPPGEVADSDAAQAEAEGRQLRQQVTDVLGDNPGREEFTEAESLVEAETGIDDVDFSSFDADQVEVASAELGRMNARGDVEGLESFRSSVPDEAREDYGDLPMHYDRDGRGVSVDPRALNRDLTGQLNEAGITATGDVEHLLQHIAATHAHAEALENGDTEAEGDPSESAEQQLEDADGAFDPAEIARDVSTLALATGATLVAETMTMVRNGQPTTDQVRRAYRFFGGPELSDVVGGDDE
jgi:hypothetical protein